MTRLKICGITNVKDAIACADLGVDIIGFIFSKSPRKISPSKAKNIIIKLPPSVHKAGVFVNEKASFINKTVKMCGLDYVQLHGDEPPAYCKKIKAKIIKAFRVKDENSLKDISKYKGKVWAVLFDSYSKNKYGGTGKAFNWDLAKKMPVPIILSGGLNPKNISKAIKSVNPYGVDLCSGVESEKGIKNERKIKKAVEIIKKIAV